MPDLKKQLPAMENYLKSMRYAIVFVMGCLVLDTIIVGAFDAEGFGEIAWSLITLVARELVANQSAILSYYVGDRHENA